MAITTSSKLVQQAIYSNAGNTNITAETSEIHNRLSMDSLAMIQDKLLTALQSYSKSWNFSVQSKGLLIDTSPAQNVLKALQPMLTASGGTLSSNSDDVMSDWEIYEDVCNKLNYMQTNYMDIYAQVTEQYQLYMQDVNTFKSSLTNYMDNGTDEIYLNIQGIKNELDKVINKWSTTPILTVQTQAEADYWQDQLGLPYSTTSSGYSFYVNLQPMYDIRDSLNSLSSPLSTARFNQWQNSVNSSCSTVESDTQIIAQKYSQANTVFNNLAKILSSTMDALYQTDKEFLRN